MDILGIAGTVFLGLVFGSFATALSYRLPRDLSMVAIKRSQCPSCRKNLAAADLVPLFSWIFLRGRCRYCQARIGVRYPVIELATLALCLVFYAVYGLTAETLLVFFLAPLIISLIDIDLHYKIIPDSLNLSILAAGVAALGVNAFFSGSPASFIIAHGGAAAAAAVAYGLGSLLLRQGAMMVMKREGMGLGDVKFFAAAGFWMGLNADAAALFMIVSGVAGVLMSLYWKKHTGEEEAPFGPSLMIAFVAVLALYPATFIIIY